MIIVRRIIMKKIFRIITLSILGIFSVFTLSACSVENQESNTNSASNNTSNSGSALSVPPNAPWKNKGYKPITVKVAFAKGMTGIANQFALANGWYEDAGIHLEMLDMSNPVGPLSAGEVDISDGDPGTYIPAIVNQVPIKIVSNMWRARGAFWIIASPEIKTWNDLKGKKVGTAQALGGMKMTTLATLEKNGVLPEEITPVANNMRQTAYASLTSGNVDATVIHQPFATIAKNEGYTVLGKTWESMPPYNTGVIVATDRILKEDPEAVKRILEVYFYANKYAKSHPDQFLPWATQYLKIDPEVAKEVFSSERELWDNDPIVNPDTLQETENLLKEYGMQDEAYSVNGVYDNTIANEIAQELELGKYEKK